MIVTGKLANSVVEFAKSSTEIVKIQAANRSFLMAAALAGRNIVPLTAVKSFANPLRPLTDQFTLVKPLSHGCFGKVGLWTDQAGHRFAIKEMIESSVNEFKIGLALDHPNIVKIHNYVTKVEEVGVRHYLIMEYIDGSTLQEFRSSNSPWLTSPIEVVKQAVDALAHMLKRNIIPDDLHSANIMVTSGGAWKFVDLGHYRLLPAAWAHDLGKEILGSFVHSLIHLRYSTPATS